MIRLFSGTPGSGKTLHAVSVMDKWNRRGKPVIANFPLNKSLLKKRGLFYETDYIQNVYEKATGKQVKCSGGIAPEALFEFSKSWFVNHNKPVQEGEILLVLDECQLIFNTRDWQFNRNWISFFTQHRKLGYEVILIAQYDRMIERQIRALLEYECKHLKVSNLGGLWGLIMPLFLGRFRVYEKWYTSGDMLIAQYRASYSKRTKALYNTFQVWQ